MMIRYILLSFLLVTIVSCRDDFERIQYIYDENGEVVRKIEYHNKLDTSDNTVSVFLDGNINKIYSKKRGSLNGSFVEYYTNGNIYRELYMKSDLFDGVQKILNEEGQCFDMSLFVNDVRIAYSTQVVDNKLTYPSSISTTDYSKYKPWNRLQKIPNSEWFINFGGIVFNSGTNEIEDKYSNSWYVFGDDTINYKDEVALTVHLYGSNQFELHIGAVDSMQNFIYPSEVKVLHTSTGEIRYKYKANKKGIDFITGKIFTTINPVVVEGDTLPYLIYHKVFVK